MLTDQIGIAVGQLARPFRAVTGRPPIAYLANSRGQAMARLVSSNDATHAEVAVHIELRQQGDEG